MVPVLNGPAQTGEKASNKSDRRQPTTTSACHEVFTLFQTSANKKPPEWNSGLNIARLGSPMPLGVGSLCFKVGGSAV